MRFETEHAYLYVHDVLYAPKIKVNLASFDRSTTDGWKWEFENGVGTLTHKGGLYATVSRDSNFEILYKLEEVDTSQIRVALSIQKHEASMHDTLMYDVSIHDVLKFFIYVARKNTKRSKNTSRKKLISRIIRTWYERLEHVYLRAVKKALRE